MVKIDERRLLLSDAYLLMRQYENRNHPDLALTPEQRKAWAAEMAAVMRALADALADVLGDCALRIDHAVAWNEQMKAGKRLATQKTRPGPPYEGVKLKEPTFVDDPSDSRGKDPRYLRSP